MDSEIDWSTATPLSLYWFCLRRNRSYRADVDIFKNKLKTIVTEVASHALVEIMHTEQKKVLGINDAVLIFSGNKVPCEIPQEIDAAFTEEELANCRLLNNWYNDFILKWRIYPQDYINHFPEPVPVKFRALNARYSEIPIYGEITSLQKGDFTFRGNALHETPKELHKRLDDEIIRVKNENPDLVRQALRPDEQKKMIKTKRSGARGPEKIDFNTLKRWLQIYSEWELFQEIDPLKVSITDRKSVKTYSCKGKKWPDTINELVLDRAKKGDKEKFKDLTRAFEKAILHINNPVDVCRLIEFA